VANDVKKTLRKSFLKQGKNKKMSELWVAAWQSWLIRPLFILEIQDQFLAQTENIFLFCLCCIWIQICKVITLEHYLLIFNNVGSHQACGKKPLTTKCIWREIILQCIFKRYWFNSLFLIKTGIRPKALINIVWMWQKIYQN
jgi:hypothetical protein